MANTQRPETGDFVPTMISFLRWYFLTLDPAFANRLLAGRSVEEGATELLLSLAASVRGDREGEARMTADDYGRIMDRLAALHLRTRHGDDAVRAGIAE